MREFGSEFEIGFIPDTYFRDIANRMPFSAFTRSGREAIGLAIEGMKEGIVLLPAYCCWSMALPFESAGWTVNYYPLKSNLSVDIHKLTSLIKALKPSVVLVMDYYGYAPTGEAVSVVKQYDEKIIVIEDFTQYLFSLPEKWNVLVDCYVASIRKSIGVPDGGMVMSKYTLDISKLSKERSTFVDEHIKAGVRKKRYAYSAKLEEKLTFRKMQAAAGNAIKSDYHLYSISPEALSIIDNTDTATIKYARKTNYEHLYDLIKDNTNFTIMFKPGDNQAPFMLIIKSDKRDELQRTLANKGIFCQVIWPVSEAAKKICPISKEMEETMLAIPIDQRYNYYDIEEIGMLINSVKL